MKRDFQKTTFVVEVLSDGPYTEEDLDNIAWDITHGDYSGKVVVQKVELLTPKEMAAALRDQGSSPSFMDIGDEGDEDDELDQAIDNGAGPGLPFTD